MFIITPKLGLCNQLQSIVKTILLGIKYNRNIYINKFKINLYSNASCDINKILDIDKINKYLYNNNINIRVLKSIDKQILQNKLNYQIQNISYDDIPRVNYLNDIIESQLNNEIIYLGNPVSLCIHKSFGYNYEDYNNLYYLIMNNLKFHKKFYIIKENIKNQLNLTNYTTVHLRIEDDALKHFSHCYNLEINNYNQKLLAFYNENINQIKEKIYICSGINNFDNKINLNYYKNIIKNKKLCDKSNLNINRNYLNNRELTAIIDLLIAYDSNNFVGCQISSFSQCIKSYLINKDKNVNLFNI